MKTKGSTLIEIIITIAIFVIITPSIIVMVLGSHMSTLRAKTRLEAVSLAIEGLEAARSIRNYKWENLTSGIHGLTTKNGYFELTATPEMIARYQRQINIKQLDPNTKQITSQINWQPLTGVNNSITLSTYLIR